MTNKNNEFNPFKSLLYIIAFILLFIVEQFPLSILVVTKKELGNNYQAYMKVAPYLSIILMIIAGIILYLVFRKAQKFPTKKFTLKTWITILISIVLIVAINYITLRFAKSSNANTDALMTLGNNNILILMLSIIVISPIFEELLFRGIFMNWFFPNHQVISAILSGIVFGFAHAPISANTDWAYAISKILLGIIIAFVYYKTKNIKANITVHFLNNVLSMVIPY
ncbi:CPBP family intramembrane glutamic endopeptidase [Companilactobacillus mishanensis]|uniref:CPBP family intramembrane metalloprotease n=1 Tax=Companilactobacillus mishanensis TaxID=2486008 RepID=A0A5P0ZGR4_9LACO|nr:type II CAAX endopeptidase family protein [Companilactobacillus mishanensis]MQS44000.1 CPBP family intramembrane metalloprotease [Companilactobacillus mishanensis]MQS52209.1 CPBP family intramembrane metalloprotease [Companilactobacillus mishanensis]MQS88299.1 CPBP family intramembrane metalloprotease [Companilactobacillus mishanensis]